MAEHKIVISGGPGTGKTSLIQQLENYGYHCYHEISRAIILEAQTAGIEQLFLEDPLRFSQKLLEGRIQQFEKAEKAPVDFVFLDRGIPDIIAYMNYTQAESPEYFIEACKNYQYNTVFLLPPWPEIHTTDNERYETLEQTEHIHEYLKNTYEKFNYQCTIVPKGPIQERCKFVINHLKQY